MEYRFHIDLPHGSLLDSRLLRLRGWCFTPDRRFVEVRLVGTDFSACGVYGLHRPDVPGVLPDAPDNFTGFEVHARLHARRLRAGLQFRDSNGAWHAVTQLDFLAPRFSRPRWLPGTTPSDLLIFQLGSCPNHPPRRLVPDNFPHRPSRPKTRLAIVTPSFNHGRFLGETIYSAIQNTDVDVTYHVQDGGSTDGTIDLLRSHTAPGFSWRSEPDGGQADAIRRAFQSIPARPDDVMAWINSDDFYQPGALRFVAEYFDRHPEVDVLYGNRTVVDESSLEVGRWHLPRHNDAVLRINDFVPQETLFWRRRTWDRANGIDPSFDFAMDWDLLLRFRDAGARIVHVPYFLACFRTHPAQKTSALMDSTGQLEINRLRRRTFGRELTLGDLESNQALLTYLRRSAWLEFLWRRLHLRWH